MAKGEEECKPPDGSAPAPAQLDPHSTVGAFHSWSGASMEPGAAARPEVRLLPIKHKNTKTQKHKNTKIHKKDKKYP